MADISGKIWKVSDEIAKGFFSTLFELNRRDSTVERQVPRRGTYFLTFTHLIRVEVEPIHSYLTSTLQIPFK